MKMTFGRSNHSATFSTVVPSTRERAVGRWMYTLFFALVGAMISSGLAAADEGGKVWPTLQKPDMWEVINGTWKFEEDGTVRQTERDEDANQPYLLRWKGDLPEQFHLSVQIKRESSLRNEDDEEISNGFVVVRGSKDGAYGHRFGFDMGIGRIRHIVWHILLGEDKSRVRFSRSRTARNANWQYFALSVDDSYYEWYYDSDNWGRSRDEMEIPRKVLIAQHNWEFMDQDELFLRVEGVPGAFRDLDVVPLNKAPPPDRFLQWNPGDLELEADGTDGTDAVVSFDRTRPVFRWEMQGEAMRWNDLKYVNRIYDERGNLVERGTTHALDREWRPRQSLQPGSRYRWILEVHGSHGKLRGGEMGKQFKISEDPTEDPDAITMKTDRVQHVTEHRPTLLWQWNWSGEVDEVNVHRMRQNVDEVVMEDGEFAELNTSTDYEKLQGNGVLAKGTFNWKPKRPLDSGLTRLELRFRKGGERLAKREAVVVHSEPTVQHEIRDREATLQVDGALFVPLGTYRDPGDHSSDTAPTSLERTLPANYTLIHAYHFESSHWYRMRRDEERLKTVFSEENLQRLIETARDFLQRAEAAGLKVFLGFKRAWVDQKHWEFIERYVAALKDEPALLTWYLYDEPNWIGYSPAHMTEVAERVREIDPDHPVSIYLNNWREITSYIRGMDIVFAGMPNTELPMAREQWRNTVHYAEAFTGETHPPAVWPVSGYHNGVDPATVWSDAYAALIGRAPGLVHYHYPGYDRQHPEMFAAVGKSNSMLKEVMPRLFAEGEELDVPSKHPRRISRSDDSPGFVEPEESDEAVMARAKYLDTGEIYVILFNYGSIQNLWRWSVPKNLDPGQSDVIYGEAKSKFENDVLTVTMKAFSGCIIRLTP